MNAIFRIYYLSILFFLFEMNALFAHFEGIGTDNNPKLSVVVIDPGHGGKDPGAVVGKAREKEIVLDVALKLGAKIKSAFPETKVLYTRDNDAFVPLHQRANIANTNKADLFISIHANAVDKSSVQGAETFVLGYHRSKENLELAKKENAVILLEDDYNTRYEGFDPNSPESYIMFELIQDEYLEQSVLFASAVQNQFKTNVKRVDRSVKQAGFLVLRRTTMPSVLIEAGFISHSAERNFLLTENGRMQIANAIFNAFSEYKKNIEDKSSFNLVTEIAQPEKIEKKEELKETKQSQSENTKVKTAIGAGDKNVYYSVQIAASQRLLDTKPSNFKGEDQVFRISSGKIHRYFCGKYNSYNEALAAKTQLQLKFGDAFVVAFEDNKIVSVKKLTEKM